MVVVFETLKKVEKFLIFHVPREVFRGRSAKRCDNSTFPKGFRTQLKMLQDERAVSYVSIRQHTSDTAEDAARRAPSDVC